MFVGNGLRNIESSAFYKCTRIKSVLLCSSELESVDISDIPSNIKFYVPNKDSYDDVFNGFLVTNIGTINSGQYEYTGKAPQLTIVPSLDAIRLSISNNVFRTP